MICYCQKCRYNQDLTCTIHTSINYRGECSYVDEVENKSAYTTNLNYLGYYVCKEHGVPCECASILGFCVRPYCNKNFTGGIN